MYKIVTKHYLPVQYTRKQVGWGCLLNATLSHHKMVIVVRQSLSCDAIACAFIGAIRMNHADSPVPDAMKRRFSA